MILREVLLPELNQEMAKTGRTLERIADGKSEFVPHPHSAPLGKLASHLAQLAEFGIGVLATLQIDISPGSYRPLLFQSGAQLVKVLNEGAAKVRKALIGTKDGAWEVNCKRVFEGKVVFESTRFLVYRRLFLNHLVHHRAQLGVYLRLNDIPLPAIYGPSADESGRS